MGRAAEGARREARVYDVTMPKLSDSMELGRIIEWKVSPGDAVHEGDALAEVESDKAVMELECFRDGVVAEIVRGDGDEVGVGEVIARIDTRAGKPRPRPPAEAGPQEHATAAPPTAPKPAVPKGERRAAVQETAAQVRSEAKGPRAEPVRETPQRGERTAVSPYAKKLAEEQGLDYRRVKGTGPAGRIVARDIEQAAARAAQKPTPVPVAPVQARAPREERAAEKPARPPAAAPAGLAAEEELPALELAEGEAEVEDAPFRLKTQARRVLASQRAIPHFFVTRAADVTALLARTDELKAKLGATITHLVAYACLRALKQRPEVNRSYDRGRVIKWKGVNLGLAVATDEGLTVAVLAGAQELSLRELVQRSSALVDRARAGKLSAEDRRHATFTITNLGMFDVEQFEPVINPPSSVTLAVSSVLPAALVKGDAIHIGKLMKLTAACDHRIVDGVVAARFLGDVCALLENPQTLLEGEQ